MGRITSGQGGHQDVLGFKEGHVRRFKGAEGEFDDGKRRKES